MKKKMLSMKNNQQKRGPFTVLSTRISYQNPWITLREDQVIRPGGSRGMFGVVEMVAGSSVLALDEDNYAYLVREYKYGIEKESIEVISGGLDGTETFLDAAKRELKEELGMAAEEWTDLGCVDPFTTVVRSPNHMFLARRLKKGAPKPEKGEDLKIVRVKFDEAVSMVVRGDITHSASCVLILKAARLLKI